MSDGIESRRYAARVVTRWLDTEDFPDRLLLSGRVPDRGFTMDLVYGTVRWSRQLQHVLAEYVREPPPPRLQAYALIGLYQLLKMEDVPDHAAIHATLEAVKKDGGKKRVGFLNAVLRRVQRERDAILSALAAAPLGIRESHPDVLIRRWEAVHGEEMTRALCQWNNRPATVCLTLLPGRTTAAAFLAAAEAAGMTLTPHPAAPGSVFQMPHGTRVPDVPGFAEGWFTVQDPATLIAVDLLDLQPGQLVLDACAAPGGKAMQISARLGETGRLVALDLHEDRMARLRENLARIGAKADIRCGDLCAMTPDALGGRADRILLDVPCSNTGVLRRRPDARWRFTAPRLAALVPTQLALLDHAVSLLAPGGKLVYSTCSLEPEENELQIASIQARHPQLRVERTVQHLPPRDETDGAFAALLVN